MELGISLLTFMLGFGIITSLTTNQYIKTLLLVGLTIIMKLLVGAESFYPIFATPIALSFTGAKLRHSSLYALLSIVALGFISGFGIWTIMQLGLFLLIIIIANKFKGKLNTEIQFCTFSFIGGFLFGVAMDTLTFITTNFFGYNNVFQQIYAGIPFDLKYGVYGMIFTLSAISTIVIAETLKSSTRELKKVKNNLYNA